jgi:predicted MPP superfamily phosphohydrolase
MPLQKGEIYVVAGYGREIQGPRACCPPWEKNHQEGDSCRSPEANGVDGAATALANVGQFDRQWSGGHRYWRVFLVQEQMLRVSEVAARLRLSEDWVRRHFMDITGVVIVKSPAKRSKRGYGILLIPEPLVEREMRKMMVQ